MQLGNEEDCASSTTGTSPTARSSSSPTRRTNKTTSLPHNNSKLSKIHHSNRIPINDELFLQLTASLKEGGAVLRGKMKAVRKTTLLWPDARAVREKLGLSQSQFAALIGISPRTLQNWEQGPRCTVGPARTLLHVAERHPEAVLEELHA